MASALEIMTQAPLGSAAFSNEFGRPNLVGYFAHSIGYLKKTKMAAKCAAITKPIMIAGGYGNIKRNLVGKNPIQQGDLLIVLGGSCHANRLGRWRGKFGG